MSHKFKIQLFAGVASLALAAPVYAQDADDGDEDRIVVTAQKRDQTLQEIPQSVSVVGGEDLERLKATTFEQYLSLIPGLALNSTQPGVNRLALRGVNTGGVSATVATYVDETPFGSSTGLVNAAVLSGDFDTFDVARIEVLRGPQGTLYGANSMGGVMKYVTNKPNTDEVSARFRAGVESTKNGELGYSGAGVLNLPLSEQAAIRGSGFYRKRGGFADSIGAAITGVLPADAFGPGAPAMDVPVNLVSDVAEDTNGSESYGGRVSLLYDATDNFSVRLTAVLQNLENEETSSIEIDPATREPIIAPDGGFVRSRFADAFSDIAYRVYNGTVEWDLGFADLISSTSYSTFDRTHLVDTTTASGGILPAALDVFLATGPVEIVLDQITDQRKFTQEVRLSSPDSDTFEWMVGGYFTRETGLIKQDINAVTPGTSMVVIDSSVLADITLDSVYKEYAGFANATLYLSDRFDLTFGGRYSHNKQTSLQEIAASFPLFIGPVPLIGNDSSEGVFTWSVAPRYDVSDYVSLYARVAKGYRPGGPNALPPSAPPGLETFDSDTVLSYEAGIKAQSANGVFAIDLSTFYLKWKDIQLITSVMTEFGQLSFNANGDTARSMGFEYSTTLKPVDGLTFLLNGAFTDAELTADAPESGGLDGDPLPITPRHTVSLNADYERPLSNDVTGYVGGTFRWQSPQSSGFVEGDLGTQLSGYETVDLRAGLLFDRYSVELFARNVFDSDALTSGGNANGSFPFGGTAGILRPRTIGATVTAEF